MSNIDRNREIFTKVWNAYKTYGHPKSEEEWEMLSERLSQIRKAYPEDFTKDLIVVILKEVEREYKRNSHS